MEHSPQQLSGDEWAPGIGNFGLFSRFEMSLSGIQIPITSTVFDPFEELLWCGNSNGKVASFYANAFDRYTAFCAVSSEVRDMMVTEAAVFTLSSNTLKANTRHGLHIMQYNPPLMSAMCAMHRLPESNSLIIGSEENKILKYDLERQKEIRLTHTQQKNATIVRSYTNNIFTADTEGNCTMRSTGSLEAVRTLAAHGGPITDFDVYGNKLITCGCSPRLNSLHGDPYVKIYDLRTFKALPPLPLAFAPIYTRFMPTFCDSRIVIVSQVGQAQVTDLNERGVGNTIIVESDGYSLTSFNFSTSKQFMAFGDELGGVHVYADRPNPLINAASWDTDFADPHLGPPQSFTIDDTNTSLASVPLPFSTDDTYLSDWPENLCQPVIRKQRPLPQYTGVKTIQFVNYAPNPRAQTPFRLFNLVPYFLENEETKVEPVVEEAVEATEEDDTPLVIPQFYRKLQLKRNRNGVIDDAAVLKLNRTNHVPLQSSAASSAVNPIAMMLFEIPALRNILLSHFCKVEHCLACQLGFLFRMLSDKPPNQPAASRNLIRSIVASDFRSLKDPDFKQTAQKLFLFLLDHIEKDVAELTNDPISDLAKSEFNMSARCIRCGDITYFNHASNVLTINYPPASEKRMLSLCTLIEKTLHMRGQREGDCTACSTKTRMEETRRVKKLPDLLLLDANATSDRYIPFWQNQLTMQERRPEYKKPEQECSLDSGGKGERACRYGIECRNRPYCKYSHGSGDWEAECATWLDGSDDQWQHYIPASFNARVNNGIAILSENEMTTECDKYELVAFTTLIGAGESTWTHATTHSKSRDANVELPWIMMNEVLVTQLHQNEALHMDHRWKLPLFLCYAKSTANIMNVEEKRFPIPWTVFGGDVNLTGNDTVAKGREEQLPLEGEIVGIDAEFINITKDHSKKKSVGRVSCVDATGQRIIIDDYVVTCAGDVVDDYLTQYSGIMEDDLDPTKSTKHLTTLKNTYVKILHLVEKGVIFVGHALNNDFSMLNIYVPTEKMIDTVQLFHLPQQRMISLQFLAWHLLGEKIQEGVHDSVEDARVALKLYHKWLELKDKGTLESVVKSLYETGKQNGWRLNGSPSKSVSPLIPL